MPSTTEDTEDAKARFSEAMRLYEAFRYYENLKAIPAEERTGTFEVVTFAGEASARRERTAAVLSKLSESQEIATAVTGPSDQSDSVEQEVANRLLDAAIKRVDQTRARVQQLLKDVEGR